MLYFVILRINFVTQSLFPLFMITPGGKRKKMFSTVCIMIYFVSWWCISYLNQAEFEEHVCSIIASLFKFLEVCFRSQQSLKVFSFLV